MPEVRIVNLSAYPLPEYQTQHSAGMDVRANISETISLRSLERAVVPTGLFVAIPNGYEIQIRPRSGLAAKQGITVLNSPGTIDADYRGEVKVILVNLSSERVEIHPGDRIAQMVLTKTEVMQWQPCESLEATDRGSGGFGSTGEK